MTVYVVAGHCQGDTEILAVFSEKEEADKYVETCRRLLTGVSIKVGHEVQQFVVDAHKVVKIPKGNQ